ncbi:MAG: copper-binding protein [Gallionella sp.]|nr:copper-binding protein [Gallionella sp.]MCK9353584.1 copper-binding protein [Gallionella sp.]
MKTVNLSLTLMIAMAATAAMAGAACAATPSPGLEMQRTASQIVKHEGYGVLKAVNTEAGKVQLAHEAIPSLGWPAMTMWFALREPLPKEVMVGDSVRFELEQTQSKKWAITRIERKR